MTTPKLHSSLKKLRDYALSLPETHEDFPWGDIAWKVAKKKAFVFTGPTRDGSYGLSVKLIASHRAALKMPFVQPTGYNLGKSGWVTARFADKEKAPLDLLKAWVEESYRAVAPKKLIKLLDEE